MDVTIKTPIRWLLGYITGRFEQTNEHFFKLSEELIKSGKLKPRIKLDNAHEGFSSGVAKIDSNGVMMLHKYIGSSYLGLAVISEA